MNKKIETGTIVRTAVLGLALANQILSATGHPIIPIEDAQLETLITTSMTVGASLWGWWKNNAFTPEARQAEAYLTQLHKQIH
ncbi:MAG: phage holin [Faecalibacterium prausnitzii]|nr:phage holin [Faecalibacterium prausnitzii]